MLIEYHATIASMFDFTIFTTAEAWISLVTLFFLEIVLGVDNIVFITITTDKLHPGKQHIGRKLGLAGALIMRIIFLSVASYLVHLTSPLVPIADGYFAPGLFSIRDIILLAGGSYLIYKGISELRAVSLEEANADVSGQGLPSEHYISLPKAIGTIMVMDIVFSIDSVITAVGMAEHLLVMIIAVIAAVLLMMVFIDAISNFINSHIEMKKLALAFILIVGILLVFDSMHITTHIEVLDMHLEKLIAYAIMLISVIVVLVRIRKKGSRG